MSKILLEICATSVDDCIVAESGGAARIELNSALMLGGLTPSLGTLMEVRQRVEIPIISMVRPRQGGFCYSAAEFKVMLKDMELALSQGADGIAFGILRENGQLDVPRCKEMMGHAGSAQMVFHRAFDVTPDPVATLEQLIDLGIKRVMTSGQEANVYNGAAKIASLIQQASGRIEILPAGGINRFNLADVIARTGCNQIHASLSTSRFDISTQSRPQVAFGGTLAPPEDRFSCTDSKAVAAFAERLQKME